MSCRKHCSNYLSAAVLLISLLQTLQYSPTPFIRTSNNQISALSGNTNHIPICFPHIAILCMCESNIFLLATIYMNLFKYTPLFYLMANGNAFDYNCNSQMKASIFLHWLLKAVLQLTLTVVFKQLRLCNYCLSGSVWTPEQ